MNQNVNLTSGDITKSLIKLSLPLALTAFIQITYNFVDIFFLGRLGSSAVAGVGIIGFIFWIANSIALIPKIGMGVYLSQAFGRGNKKEIIRVLNNGFLLTLFVGLIYSIGVFLVRNIYVDFYGLTEAASNFAKEYLFVFSFGVIFYIINPVLSQSFQSMGNSITPFKINTIGLVINIILDPIFIFGFGPIPRMEATGAALATSLAQGLVTLIFIIEIKRHNELLDAALSHVDYQSQWVSGIFKMGFPAAVMSLCMAVISIILNKFMAGFGEAAVAAYTVGSQLESITWNTTEGLQVGIAAMVGQNYGAGLRDRVREAIKRSFQLVLTLGFISMVVLFFFRYPLFKLFVPTDRETIELGALYLAILSVSQVFMSVEIGMTGAFNGMGETRTPARISLSLNIARIPLSLILMPIFGVAGVWVAMSLTSILKGLINGSLLIRKVKRELY